MKIGARQLRERRRREIVAAARAVFAERGYHHASIADVIARARIARGTFYLYFSGKRDVFESLLEEEVEDLRARIRPIDTGPEAPPAHAQLRDMLVRVLDYVLENRDFTRLLLVLWMNPDVEVAKSVQAFYARVMALVVSSLERGMRLGLVRRLDPPLVAAALLGTVRGILGHLLEARRPPRIERVADELIALAIGGVGVERRW